MRKIPAFPTDDYLRIPFERGRDFECFVLSEIKPIWQRLRLAFMPHAITPKLPTITLDSFTMPST
jgi:hypothetical protein